MNKLIFIIVVLLVSLISYVVFAVSQQAIEGRDANAVLAEIMRPEVDALAENPSAKQDLGRMQQRLALGSASRRCADLDALALERLPSNAPNEPLKLTISPTEQTSQATVRQFEFRFENCSDQPVKILKPLDGSFYGWYQPHYMFTAHSEDGKSLPLFTRCGNSGLWADTEFPKSYLVEVEPQETFSMKGYLPLAVEERGEYQIVLEYRYEFDVETDPVKVLSVDRELLTKPVEGVWQGRVKSNTLTLELEKNR